jgi:hypothetical protein
MRHQRCLRRYRLFVGRRRDELGAPALEALDETKASLEEGR